MSFWTLIWRSLAYHWRAHVGVVLGMAVGSAVLIGALIVGDSVRGSLRDLALQRLGGIHYALVAGDRLFREQLAQDLSSPDTGASGLSRTNGTALLTQFAPVLMLSGTAVNGEGTARANQVQVVGVDPRFTTVAGPSWDEPIPAEGVAVNAALAAQLQVKSGDTIILRLRKPTALAAEAVIAPQADVNVALRLRVSRVVLPEALGNLSLSASQMPPMNAFVALATLQQQAGVKDQANLVFAGPLARESKSETTEAGAVSALSHRLQSVWQMADAQLDLAPLPGLPVLELRSPRIFLDPEVMSLGLKSNDTTNLDEGVQPILTYLVNQMSSGPQSTPYSMVTAAGPPWTPPDLKEDEVVITQWLADDLRVGPGAEIALTYFDPASSSALIEHTNRLRVRSVVPLTLPWADRTLMPEFPGIAKAESTHDWDAGFPLVHKLRPADDAYWKQWRGTPKAFVSLAAGQKMWANRFGGLTAVRFPATPGMTEKIEKRFLTGLAPEQMGLRFEAVRARALTAADQAQDFGGLFLGFSFFLIVAALLLVGLLFQLGLEKRIKEIGVLLALGFRPRQVRRLFLMEGGGLAVLGAVLGLLGGMAYAQLMLRGLATLWRDAVGTSSLAYHASFQTLAIGLGSALLVSAGALVLVLRKTAKQPARILLSGTLPGPTRRTRSRGRWLTMGFGLLTVLLILGAILAGAHNNPLVFFGAGSLGLMTTLAAASWWLSWMDHRQTGTPDQPARLTLMGLAVRGVCRHRKRSLSTVALLACGIFLVVAVGANRLEADRHAAERSSGTGGFALIGQSALPLVKDLNTAEGREFYGLNAALMQGVTVVPFRVSDGEDASCLNLNRAQRPRILGVDPGQLHSRGAFTFAQRIAGPPTDLRWWLLRRRPQDPLIPAIGDEASIVWALGKRLGQTLDLEGERGTPMKLWLVGMLANSILQGNLVIAEEEFKRLFPRQTGYRFFLVDVPAGRGAAVSAELTRQLSDYGMELVPAPARLAQFNAVQNTYLNTFQLLGGLGLLLGSLGLGIVVMRNVLERRAELALLLAVGFRFRTLMGLVLGEHTALLMAGVVAGMAAALIAVLPVLLSPGAARPLVTLGLLLGGVLVQGLIWTGVAAYWALRGDLLPALRAE